MALAFALPWLALGRGWSERMLDASAHFALGTTLAAIATLILLRTLTRAGFALRFCAALVAFVLATIVLSSISMALQQALSFHRLGEIPIRIVLIILGISGAGSLYNVLTVALPLMLPLGLPLATAFAWISARGGPRVEESPGSAMP